jgi:uncharacterized protein (DUF58 family)
VRRWLNPPRALKPTRAGWLFFVITMGVGFAALNTGNNLLYLVLSLMLAFLALSGFLSESALRGITVERELPREIFAGQSNRVLLRIANRQPKVASFAIVIEDAWEDPRTRRRKDRARDAAGRCFALRVGPEETVVRPYALIPEQRGWTKLAGQRISTRFPFGLFVKSKWVDMPTSLLVYPGIDPVTATRSGGGQERVGERERGLPGQGAEVSQLREYAPGDSARRIHWRSSLRRDELVVGEVEESDDAEIEVLLRTARDGPDTPRRHEAFEQRVRDAASEVVTHLEAGLRVALRTDRERIEPAAGPRQRARLLSFLALVTRESGDEPQPGTTSTTPQERVS